MVEELKEMGIELMVSIWPTVEETSENYKEMEELGYLTRSEHGKRLGQLNVASVIDVTNPDARKYVWEKIKKNYYDLGIKIFWLDEAEPEYGPYDFDNYRYYAGPALQCSNIYPVGYAKGFYDGLKSGGRERHHESGALCMGRQPEIWRSYLVRGCVLVLPLHERAAAGRT